jgi:hypothetical protein
MKRKILFIILFLLFMLFPSCGTTPPPRISMSPYFPIYFNNELTILIGNLDEISHLNETAQEILHRLIDSFIPYGDELPWHPHTIRPLVFGGLHASLKVVNDNNIIMINLVPISSYGNVAEVFVNMDEKTQAGAFFTFDYYAYIELAIALGYPIIMQTPSNHMGRIPWITSNDTIQLTKFNNEPTLKTLVDPSDLIVLHRVLNETVVYFEWDETKTFTTPVKRPDEQTLPVHWQELVLFEIFAYSYHSAVTYSFLYGNCGNVILVLQASVFIDDDPLISILNIPMEMFYVSGTKSSRERSGNK